jgi:uncharacterized protein YcbX
LHDVTADLRIASLLVYPLKGARGIALERAEVRASGIRHDRRYMLVEVRPGGAREFVTQRAHPAMALVATAIDGDALVLRTPGGEARVPLEGPAPRGSGGAAGAAGASISRRRVRVWDDEVDATLVTGDAAELLSDHLGVACELYHLGDADLRQVELPYARPGDRVGFADAYPLLLASLASLADLNARLPPGAPPVPMDRFRPSVVVEGGQPYDEDRHARVRLGSLDMRMPKRCARCAVTTVDQATGEIGAEPLRTLAAYRASDAPPSRAEATGKRQIHFAMNVIPDDEGTLAVGDPALYMHPIAAPARAAGGAREDD